MKTLDVFLKESVGSIISEAVRSRDIEKAISLISKYLRKHKINTLPEIRDLSVDNQRKLGVVVWNDNNEAACFVWDIARAAQIESALFTKDFNSMNVAWACHDDFVWDLEVQALGANTLKMALLVDKILTGKIAMTQAAAYKEIEDAQLFEDNDNEGTPVNEDDMSHLIAMRKKRDQLAQKISYRKSRGQDYADLQTEYDDLRAKIAGASINVRASVPSNLVPDPEVEKLEQQFEEERPTPEERFEDMELYIRNVIAGVKPLALICGAPGVGKTFRITQALKRAGKDKNSDYILMKGKCTPNYLFQALHDYKNEGQLVVMDDCDNVFRDDDSINLLKAAYDSSDERWVSWNTAAMIPMPQDIAETCDDAYYNQEKNKWYYPREFLYEGSGIIITNFRAGQIDTAIRNRALICDLDFTPEETIDYIESISDKIMPDKYNPESKARSLQILREMYGRGETLELSIRSFTLIAGLVQGEGTEKSKMRCIREQMRNLAARGGKKY